METARLKREQSEPAAGRSQKVGEVVRNRLAGPTALDVAHAPVLRLTPGACPSQLGLQAKLTVNQPGDQFEQEADRVADQVMRMPDSSLRLQRKCGCGSTSAPDAQCNCGQIQRRVTPANSSSAAPVPPLVHDVLRSPGHPLDQSTRAFFESRMGHDFSGVRVHTSSKAASSASAIAARAYTLNSNIVFGSGEYAPHTESGRRLLSHELAHVVQQSASHERSPDVIQRQTGGSSGPASRPLPEAVRILRSQGSTGAGLLTAELVNGVRSAETMFLRERPFNRWAESFGWSGTVGPGQLGQPAIAQVDRDFATQRTAFAAIFGAPPATWEGKATDPNWSYFYVAAYLVYSINRAESVFQPATPVITNVQMGIVEIGIALYHGAFEMIRAIRRRIATSKGIAASAVTIQMVEEELRAAATSPAERELGRYIGLARGYFDFTFSITAVLRQSRRFWISDGKVKITSNAHYQTPTPSSSSPRGNTYYITLHRFQTVSSMGAAAEGTNPQGTRSYNVGARQVAEWVDLPRGDYMFRVEKNEGTYSPDVLEGQGRVETTY